jgi:hypothetical protein
MSSCTNLSHIQVFPVSIVNDTGGGVVVRDCANFCSSSPLVFDLPPGSKVQINRTTKMHKYFSVTTSSGAHVGCLDLYFKTPAPGASVPVWRAFPCPSPSGLPWRTIGIGLLVLTPILLIVKRLITSQRPT